MNNETLKIDLSQRTAFGLNVFEARTSLLFKVYGFDYTCEMIKITVGQYDDDDWVNLSQFKPILFNSLTEPITINGETFVPIVRMFHEHLSDEIDIEEFYPEFVRKGNAYEFTYKVYGEEYKKLCHFPVDPKYYRVWQIDFMNRNHINYRLSPDQFIPATNEYA